MIAVSIVSHGHGAMVEHLVAQLLKFTFVRQILLTHNIPEHLNLPNDCKIIIFRNLHPKGFAENHNAAFDFCSEPFFCALNPDVKFIYNPFPELLNCFKFDCVSLVAPLVLGSDGSTENSARYFPTPFGLLKKIVGLNDGSYDFSSSDQPFYPEWVAGMFMLFRSDDFDKISGFDEKYFLYYEDVDICVRLWGAGRKVLMCPHVSVIHDARRDSHHSFKYFRWHFVSMLVFFWKHYLRLPLVRSTFF